MIELPSPHETELCAWGCGQPARFYSDKSYKPQWTCTDQWQKCPAKIKVGRQKYRDTMISRYGVDVPMKDPTKDLQRRQTNLERYGAEQVMQSSKVLTKYRKTLKDRYGATHISQIPGVLEKADKTRTVNGTQGGDTDKKIATCRAKYGTDWPMQDPTVFQRNLDSCFKSKPYTLSSGASVSLQGYEPYVMDYLLSHGHTESEFLWKRPSFWWIDNAGKRRRYHPDLVLPASRSIIEVKAAKWFERDKDNIKKKGKACMDAGWEFTLAVMNDSLRKRNNPITFIPFRSL